MPVLKNKYNWINLVIVILGTTFLALSFFPFQSSQDRFEVKSVKFKFLQDIHEVDSKENFDHDANGLAEINGSRVWIEKNQSFLRTFGVCNHEMQHIHGKRDGEMTWWEKKGLIVDDTCVNLMFKVIFSSF